MQELNPWVSMWTQPRATVRHLLESPTTLPLIFILAALGGVSQVLDRAAERNMADTNILLADNYLMIFPIALIAGSIGGIIGLYISSRLVAWSGSLIGGQGDSEDLRVAMAWSNLPVIASLLLWPVYIALYGREMFTELSPLMEQSPMAALGLALIEITLGIWAIVIALKAIGEVHQFSAWKALGACLLAAVIVIGAVMALVFFLGIVMSFAL